MKGSTIGKLVGGWLAVTIASILTGLFWIRPESTAGCQAPQFWKLALLLALATASGFVFTYLLAKRWSERATRLERFAAALPMASEELPDEGPPELRDLSRAMKRMAEQVRRIVERSKLESSRRETVLAGMAEGVLAVDENLKVVFCNDAFAQAFSTRTPVTEGRALYEVVREPALRDILQLVLTSGESEKDQFRSPTADGRWFEAHALPLGDSPRRGALAVLHDVTDIQRQEQARKDFVANVSHELRTPLTAIRGYAETLLDGALEDKKINRKFVEVILAQAIRLNNIASDLLVLSELDANAPAASPDRISVREVVDSAINTVQSSAAMRSVRINRDRCTECVVTGYRFRLEQALVNLLDNAIKFNREQGEVTIECGYTGDGRVRISVADTGIGIPSEDLKRVFERFYRVDKARGRAAGGTGLGLPIVKEVVERMGGTVSVESQLGKGTRFTLTLQAATLQSA
ncbi:MAG TPA: ATP-binding protein [Bryobacteraceae bacterium]|nr:ATP-binding protein [Bryobacteraceae bacterium]